MIGVTEERVPIDPSATSATTIADTILVYPGSTIVAWVTWDDGNVPLTASCSDGTNTFNVVGPFRSAADQQSCSAFWFTYGAGGSKTITVTFGAPTTTPFRGLALGQVVGGVLISALNVSAGQNQATPGASTTSGAATNTLAPAFVYGFCGDMHNANQPTADTANGFTSGRAFWGASARTEWKRVTATGSQQATFIPAVNEDHITIMLVFAEAEVGLQPGITPFDLIGPGRFRDKPFVPRIQAFTASPPPAVPPLSWFPEGASPVLLPVGAVQPGFVRPLLPIVAVAPPLSWAPSLDKSPPQPIPSAPLFRRVSAFESSPGAQDLSWEPELQVSWDRPAAAPVGSSVGPVQPVAFVLPPLTWQEPQPVLVLPPVGAPPSRLAAPVAPIASSLAPLTWQAIAASVPLAAPSAAPSLLVAPFSPALPVPALAWGQRGVTAFAPVLGDADSGGVGPFAPQVTPPGVGWLPDLTRTSDPPLIPGQGGAYAPPFAGYVIVPIEWAPRGATAFAPFQGDADVGAVGPFAPQIPTPGLGWLPRWLPPYVPLGLESDNGSVGPFAPQVTPPGLGWLPALAPLVIAPARAADAGAVRPALFSFVVPPLAWLPTVAPTPPPGRASEYGAVGSALPIPTFASPPMAWAPRLAPAGMPTPPVPFGGAVAPLSPSFPVPPLAWSPRGQAAVLEAVRGQSQVVQFGPFVLAQLPPLSWFARAAVTPALPIPAAGSAAASPLLPPVAPALSWSPAGIPPVLPASPGPVTRAVAPLQLPGLPPLSWGPEEATAPPPLVAGREARAVAPLSPLAPPPGWAAIAERTAENAYLPLRAEPAPTLSRAVFPELPRPNPPVPVLSWQGISGLYFPPPLWIPLELRITPVLVPPPPPLPQFPLPPPFVVQLVDEGGPVDLTGKTVVCRTQPADRSRAVRAVFADVVDALRGLVQHAWAEQDLRGVPTGDVLLQFVVFDSSGKPRTYPGQGRYYHQEITGRTR